MRMLWLIALLLSQVMFIVAGLGITFYTLTKWDQDKRLDAIFGAGIGSYCFFVSWLLLRRWVREHPELWRKQ